MPKTEPRAADPLTFALRFVLVVVAVGALATLWAGLSGSRTQILGFGTRVCAQVPPGAYPGEAAIPAARPTAGLEVSTSVRTTLCLTDPTWAQRTLATAGGLLGLLPFALIFIALPLHLRRLRTPDGIDPRVAARLRILGWSITASAAAAALGTAMAQLNLLTAADLHETFSWSHLPEHFVGALTTTSPVVIALCGLGVVTFARFLTTADGGAGR